MSFRLTRKQERANQMLGADAMHNMLYGGSRSGKTFLLMRAIATRAIAKESRHAVLRFRFNAIKASIIYDTLPKVMKLCFPEIEKRCELNKSDWFYTIPCNGGGWSEIWFGGLDDKDRTEKILGQEYATLLLNECSQIPWASRNMAVTRVAQNAGLRLKMYYDCNPPSKAHWTYKVFVEKKDPDKKVFLTNPENFNAFVMNPLDNQENLPEAYISELQNLPERERRRFFEGLFADTDKSALWYPELLDQQRIVDGTKLPDMQRILIAVDPSGCSGPEDTRSDEIGIIVSGLGVDGKGYVLEDLSGRHSAGDWPKIVVAAYDRHGADRVVGEKNYGGDMVRQVIHGVRSTIPYKPVDATRGKVVRAEPISTLFEQQKIYLSGHFPELEEQMCAMTTHGYMGSKSPDRADAMVWGLTELFPAVTKDKVAANAPLPNVVMSRQAARRRR
jgi:phage terminase large subunit-like protein